MSFPEWLLRDTASAKRRLLAIENGVLANATGDAAVMRVKQLESAADG